MVTPITKKSHPAADLPADLPAQPLTVSMRAFLAGAAAKQASLIALTEKLVRAESPSDTKAAVDACGQLAAEHARSLGGRVKIHKQRHHGDVLELRFNSEVKDSHDRYANVAKPGSGSRGKDSRDRVLILGHIDTVWPVGTLKTMPCRIAPDKAGQQRLWGPGTLDMKVGVAMAFTAIEMLLEADLLNREIIVLLNSDEEIGSPVSRPITEKLASECSAVYVLEPAQTAFSKIGLVESAAYKTARKGTGNWRIEVTGIGAHAGVDFTSGANALLELSRQIEAVSQWTELDRGLTVSVNVAGAGNKTNVIPASAWAEVDVRLARKTDGPRIARKFAALKPHDTRCTLTVTGGVNRPPMERIKGTAALFAKARALASDLGIQLEEAATGGASDGNFTAALGIATLDGMGAVGEGAHAPHESILIEYLAPRTALLAGLLAQ